MDPVLRKAFDYALGLTDDEWREESARVVAALAEAGLLADPSEVASPGDDTTIRPESCTAPASPEHELRKAAVDFLANVAAVTGRLRAPLDRADAAFTPEAEGERLYVAVKRFRAALAPAPTSEEESK